MHKRRNIMNMKIMFNDVDAYYKGIQMFKINFSPIELETMLIYYFNIQ